MQALGAEAQQIKFAELYVALQQGVVDGQENPLVNIHASKLYEVQKYISLTGHKFQMTPFLMSKRTWDRLSDADRKAVQEAAAEATALQRKLSQESDDKLIGEFRKMPNVRSTNPTSRPSWRPPPRSGTSGRRCPVGEFVKKLRAESAKL